MRLAALIGLVLAATPVSAQQITLGAEFAFSDYREQADFLHFQGIGPAALLKVEYGRFTLRADAWHLSMDPSGDAATGLEPFTADEIDLRLGVQAVSVVTVEAGYTRRSVSPSRGAQSYSAATLGFRATYPLAPGAEVSLRTSYVAGTDFTGGGSAPFGIDLGLSAGFGPGSGRYRLTGDYGFQRIDRRTDQNGTQLKVPIQSSVARLGVAVRF
jgi:hypothetical protein